MIYDIERIFDEEYAKGYAQGYAKGMKIGIQQGIKQAKRDAVKALIGLLDDEIIAEKIGLKLEEVKKLHQIL